MSVNRLDYKQHELNDLSDSDIALAQVIIDTAMASWTINGRFRVNTRTARFFGTTTKRLRRIFPESWYENDYDNNELWVVLRQCSELD